MALRLRATFIDYDEDEAQCHEGEVRRTRARARTLPLPAAEHDGLDVFDFERAYLSDLSGKLSSLWGMGEAPSYGDVKGFFQGSSDPTKQLAGRAASEQQEINEAASDRLLRAKLDEELLAPCDDSATRSPSSEGGELLSDGSLGHPDICARPCLHFAAGQCAQGNSCSFCHLPHSKRPIHLDKKHREVLQKTPSERLKALLLPLLREKLLSFDDSAATLQDFEVFVHECGFESASAALEASEGRAPRSDRSLIVACRAMSFRLLLVMITRTAFRDDARAQSASTALLEQLLQRRAPVA